MISKERFAKACNHVINCIDGELEPPKWLHRSHRLGHVLYLGTALCGVEILHHGITYGLVCVEMMTFVVGAKWTEFDEIDEVDFK